MEKNNQDKIKYFTYRRKSTDEPERQVLSLESQEEEIESRFRNLKRIDLPSESVSAFKPYKRPIFREMIERIQKGEAQGIIAWHPDRLSRNPIDAAQIIYLLDIGVLKDLKFCSYTFDNTPEGKMLLQITMSQSKYSSDKLSGDVSRGMRKKAATGWRPGRAPLGYLNSKTKLKGQQDVASDPERFHIVKQLWEIMLTGNYTVPEILELARDNFKLTQPATPKKPERQLPLSTLYRMFGNPYYYGWYEWNGEWTKGNHEPMITQEEFNRVQKIIGRKGAPRPKEHRFAFTGLMRCGGCGAAITAEEKIKRQKNGNVHTYVYYRCTKKIDPNCTEKSLELEDFNRQVDALIQRLSISERFQKWALKYLHEIRKEEAKTHEDSLAAKQKALHRVVEQLDSLVVRYIAPENADESILTSADVATAKKRLLSEKARLEGELAGDGRAISEWVELSERTFNFARYARIWFAQGDLKTKRAIFTCLGSNLLLQDRKVSLALRIPFKLIFEGIENIEEELLRLEPLLTLENTGDIAVFRKHIPLLSG